jgi:hypothetical protein
VQKRLSRKQVHRAFDDLLANAGGAAIEVPTDASGKMSQLRDDARLDDADTASSKRSSGPRGPRSGPRK